MAQKKDSFFLAARPGKRNTGHRKPDETEKKPFRVGNKKDDVESGEAKAKKPFDKKAYRIKKYSNKYKLEKWEDQRKKKLLRNYYKELESEAPAGTYKPINFDDASDDSNENESAEVESSVGRYVRHPDTIDEPDEIEAAPQTAKPQEAQNSKAVKKDAFWRAKAEFGRLKRSKEEKKKDVEKSKREREQKLLEYRKKKSERFKKLSRKTKKGQPVMTGRLELLLEKIVSNK